ncbi:hypothetical protein Cgig2_017491 [Carnegiea gigantea]|uniref:UDP-glucuronate decarboxylase n=1 Tax=Carnegiea gigantea TaxID=171969 RepID=A0A9Q1KM88_9CARY|nr:hypothetical protein Cgig2_017491 [Carnegiea gigantea]
MEPRSFTMTDQKSAQKTLKASVGIIRRDEEMSLFTSSSYCPKALKYHRPLPRSLTYLLREQRLLFILVGILIGSTFFILQPSLLRLGQQESIFSKSVSGSVMNYDQVSYRPRQRSWAGIMRLRIVVTGGAGFVGSHLVDNLIARGDNVIIINNFFTGRKENVLHHFGNTRFNLIRHDVVQPILLKVDQIYHLACPASPVHYKHNPRVGARFLLTSTSEVYGDPLQHPQKETYWGHVNPIGVRSCYDEGKRTAETLTMDYHRGADVIQKEPMTVYGDGKQTRSFQYVSDLVEGLVALMEGEHVGPFNLGNPGEFTMLELAGIVKEIIDPTTTIAIKPNTADDPHQRKPDISKAKELLNWKPKVSLREGLPLMVTDFHNRILNEVEGKAH